MLDADRERLLLPGRDPISLAGHGGGLVLQQPGEDQGVVLVATDGELLSVRLGSGSVEVLSKEGTGDAVRPVRYQGRSYGAWQARRYGVRVTDGRSKPLLSQPGDRVKGLRFQVGKNLVVLVNPDDGTAAYVDDDDKNREIKPQDWDKVSADSKVETQSDGADSKTVATESERSKQPSPPAPQPDDKYGTRPGRPVIVPVLLNDKDANGDVLVVTRVKDVKNGTAGVVADGTAVQVLPTGDQPVTLRYTVSDGTATADADVIVKVNPDGKNSPPEFAGDGQGGTKPSPLEAAVGAPLEANLLRGWFDPEGDAFFLRDTPGYEPEVAAGWFGVEPDGRITGEPFEAKATKVRFDVVDELGDAAKPAIVDITIRDDAPVKPYPDVVFAHVGENAAWSTCWRTTAGPTCRVTQLPEPTGPRSDKVTAEVVDGGRKLSVRADSPGEYVVPYRADRAGSSGDGQEGLVRLLVPDPAGAGKQPPVAGVDIAVAKPDVPVTVDVLHNDSDPDADVLIVTEATSENGAEVQVVDHRFVRVRLTSLPDSGTVPVRYKVSDGRISVEGLVRIAATRSAVTTRPCSATTR